MDEIGRGTSTYDGVSIAWAIVEYLSTLAPGRPKTLFATHYHELNQLADQFEGVVNFNVSVKEVGDKVIFLRTLKPGGSEHSFGIHVAQMAGMPNPIVIRASEIMHFLEKDRRTVGTKKVTPPDQVQLSMFESDEKFIKLRQELTDIDINTISPVEALLKLNELKDLMSSGKMVGKEKKGHQ